MLRVDENCDLRDHESDLILSTVTAKAGSINDSSLQRIVHGSVSLRTFATLHERAYVLQICSSLKYIPLYNATRMTLCQKVQNLGVTRTEILKLC